MKTAHQRLAATFKALGSPTRLQVLQTLEKPHSPGAITVYGGKDGRRPVARQVVRRHLSKLVAAGIVREWTNEHSSRFEVNSQELFRASEDLLDLARVLPVMPADSPTQETSMPTTRRLLEPHLTTVRGMEVGRVYPLATRREQMVGRARGTGVCLDYDPYVSREHARITWSGGRHFLEDLGSKNGTSLNFDRLERGVRAVLATGDIVGVGRSLFVYRA